MNETLWHDDEMKCISGIIDFFYRTTSMFHEIGVEGHVCHRCFKERQSDLWKRLN